MNASARFVACVQTGALVWETLRVVDTLRKEAPPRKGVDCFDVVGRASDVDEAALAGLDVAEAARAFVLYAYGEAAAPAWYEEWRERAGARW